PVGGGAAAPPAPPRPAGRRAGGGGGRGAALPGHAHPPVHPRRVGGVTPPGRYQGAATMRQESVAIIGAGPAGLTAAYLLAKNQVPVTVLEADATYVGGISRTARYKDYHFDIGGHPFFSKSKEVEGFWTEVPPRRPVGPARASPNL